MDDLRDLGTRSGIFASEKQWSEFHVSLVAGERGGTRARAFAEALWSTGVSASGGARGEAWRRETQLERKSPIMVEQSAKVQNRRASAL